MIYCPEESSSQNHSCTLQTVLSIEHFIKEHSGQFSKTELWNALPKKIMYQSYKVVLSTLISLGKISTQGKKVVWVEGASTLDLDQFTAKHHASTLKTVHAVYEFTKANSGQFSKTELWNNLPKKIMYQSYKLILAYLIQSGALAIENRKVTVPGGDEQ